MIGENAYAALWLNAVVGFESRKIARFSALGYPPERIRYETRDFVKKFAKVIDADAERELLDGLDRGQIERIAEDLDQLDMGFVVSEDFAFPERLRQIADPPACLYYRGDLALLKSKSLAVVGTRNPTRYGKEVTENFVKALSGLYTIVSGMARGIDAIAHREALRSGGKTIAVLGSGIDRPYPSEHVDLYHEIAERGLVVSEYGLNTGVQQYRFPQRNRIISGLSRGVLVTEAGEKSGSLITAEYAVEQGKELFVVPSAVTNPRGTGTNRLLVKYPAAITITPDAVAEGLGDAPCTKPPAPMQLDYNEAMIREALVYREMHFEELLMLTGLGVSALTSLLTQMEMLGIIKKLDHNYYGV